MQKLYQQKDQMLNTVFCIPPSDTIYNVVLSAGVAQNITIPTGAEYVIIASTTNVWVNCDGSASVPSATATSGANSELNPGGRIIKGKETISLISSSSCLVSLAFYVE